MIDPISTLQQHEYECSNFHIWQSMIHDAYHNIFEKDSVMKIDTVLFLEYKFQFLHEESENDTI